MILYLFPVEWRGYDDKPLVNAELRFYSLVEFPPRLKPVYLDEHGLVPAPQPVLTDSKGEAILYGDGGGYRVTINDKEGGGFYDTAIVLETNI